MRDLENRLALHKKQDKAREARLKDQAFFDWHNVPAGCDHRVRNAEMVRCAKDSMRKRTEFDRMWTEGRIR